MAKKRKRARTPKTCMMVIRVAVPFKDAKTMKVATVLGRKTPQGYEYDLEILNAYYDLPFQPTAFDG